MQNGAFTEVQSLISPQNHVTIVAVQSDNSQILTYDCTEESIIIWEYGKCSSDKHI